MEKMKVKFLRLAFPLYLIALGFTVLTPKKYTFTDQEGFLYEVSSFFQPFHENTFGWITGNLLMLAPLGIMLLLLIRKLNVVHISFICFASAGAIELSQNLIDSRIPDLGTVMINGIGATICTLFFDRWRRVHS